MPLITATIYPFISFCVFRSPDDAEDIVKNTLYDGARAKP
ncbi:hypothetical protein E5Q_02250 [Mixia osmundae IAM 14324]|uniref:Uncharacterized protein n=1 Tax=Mixia osmundae (strain CBS 9802 / IAM 14324 / JCM 22182 / KY 12970) TaxID=764103 RepID=G7DYD4_MIXOS|nr:hypothetical protein E5Q_02250 [Mixia osmundae IAM 14324]